MTPRPFTLSITDGQIDDLRERLARTRFPDQAPGEPWAYGADLEYLRDLITYWRTEFDWRAQEAAVNAFPQSTAEIGDLLVHFLHVPGEGPAPVPLLLLHGWPGSVFEFLDIIPRLTRPSRFGGDPQDSFTVVVPSLPGFGLSFRPGQRRCGVPEMADCLHELMTSVLGYQRYGAQGGDWGSGVASRLGYLHPESLIGIHLNFLMPVSREPADYPDPTPAERKFLGELAEWVREETGYAVIQGTKPQTLAFAMTDSPAGLAAWIAEKFRRWSDWDTDFETVIDRDRMLANIALFWFTGAIGSSFWPYYARIHGAAIMPKGDKITVPAAHAAFPKEIIRPPRESAERVLSDLRQWTILPKGGHFAAAEQPAALAGDVASFFRPLR